MKQNRSNLCVEVDLFKISLICCLLALIIWNSPISAKQQINANTQFDEFQMVNQRTPAVISNNRLQFPVMSTGGDIIINTLDYYSAKNKHTGQSNGNGVDVRLTSGYIYPVSPGVIISSGGGPNDERGYYVVIAHPNKADAKFYSCYFHLKSKGIAKGEKVDFTTVIGKVGNTGTKSTGAHLHFEIYGNNKKDKPSRTARVDKLLTLKHYYSDYSIMSRIKFQISATGIYYKESSKYYKWISENTKESLISYWIKVNIPDVTIDENLEKADNNLYDDLLSLRVHPEWFSAETIMDFAASNNSNIDCKYQAKD